jgi:nucleotide-binding universal stress UspA family protein
MQRILVATDGSEGADRAIDYAAHQAKAAGVELLIVNVFGSDGLPSNIFQSLADTNNVWLKEAISSASAEVLRKARDRARNIGVNVIHLESRVGDIAQTILVIAQEKSADLIVVGKRGNGRLAGLLLGSVSQKLASLASIPVTIVP